MIRTLLQVRFRAIFAGMTAQTAKRKKRTGVGTIVLYCFLYLYLLVVFGGAMCLLFSSLAEPYHAMGLDWLYFSMAGLIGLALSLFGSVFTTQSQLYNAKDNDLLLSMPLSPKVILLSRMVPLLALNLVFSGIVLIPAIAMYALHVSASLSGIVCQLIVWICISFLVQSFSCLLGWLLHLLLSRMNKSVASLLYMVVFLGTYFYVYGNANRLLQALAANGQQIASGVKSWVWPLYALGRGALGSVTHLLAFGAVCFVLFALVYWLLSVTFIKAATAAGKSRKRKRLNPAGEHVRTPMGSITRKELRKFLTCPVYLTNMGLGLILTLAPPVAALIFRDDIAAPIRMLGLADYVPLIICAILCFTISTSAISTPSVSLEGKSIWILKSMPLSGKQILQAKLHFHLLMTVPVSAAAGLCLALTFGCDPFALLLCAAVPSLLALLSGVLGLWAGLKWARLDYTNESYPCKQSISVAVGMFGLMGVPLVFGLAYGLWLHAYFTPTVFLCLAAAALCAICCGLYRVIVTWGVRKWDSL